MESGPEDLRWHEALLYAVTGERRPELPSQRSPDLDAVASTLGSESQVEAGQVWPHPVPKDLMEGIGAAQFSAALGVLRARLGLEAVIRPARVSRSVGPAPADERLLREVPPHHGT